MLSAAELTAALADNVNHPWKPPGGGLAGALTHDIIHGLDITVPLGIERQVPPDRLGVLLAGLGSPKTLRFFGVDLSGVELRATDTDAAVAGWAFGSDAARLASGSDAAGLASGSDSPVTGAAQDLALVLCGRKLPKGHLEGENSDRFTVA